MALWRKEITRTSWARTAAVSKEAASLTAPANAARNSPVLRENVCACGCVCVCEYVCVCVREREFVFLLHQQMLPPALLFSERQYVSVGVCACVSMCVCVCERERVFELHQQMLPPAPVVTESTCVCAHVWVGGCVGGCARKRGGGRCMCVCVRMCSYNKCWPHFFCWVGERERVCVCVWVCLCVCLCVWERERWSRCVCACVGMCVQNLNAKPKSRAETRALENSLKYNLVRIIWHKS